MLLMLPASDPSLHLSSWVATIWRSASSSLVRRSNWSSWGEKRKTTYVLGWVIGSFLLGHFCWNKEKKQKIRKKQKKITNSFLSLVGETLAVVTFSVPQKQWFTINEFGTKVNVMKDTMFVSHRSWQQLRAERHPCNSSTELWSLICMWLTGGKEHEADWVVESVPNVWATKPGL